MENEPINRKYNPFYYDSIKKKGDDGRFFSVPATTYKDELKYVNLPNMFRRYSTNCLICGERSRGISEHLKNAHNIDRRSEAEFRHKLVIHANHEKTMDRQLLPVEEVVKWAKVPDILPDEDIKTYRKRLKALFLKRFCQFHEAAGGYVFKRHSSKCKDLLKSGLSTYKIGEKPDFELPPPFEEWRTLRIKSIIAPNEFYDYEEPSSSSSEDEDDVQNVRQMNVVEKNKNKETRMELGNDNDNDNDVQIIENPEIIVINNPQVSEPVAQSSAQSSSQSNSNENQVLYLIPVADTFCEIPVFYVTPNNAFSFF